MHITFWVGIMPVLNGYLVTLRYCELSVTKSLFLCLFLHFSLLFALRWTYAHALKSSFLCFYKFIHCLTICCLLGSHMLPCLWNSFMWDLCTVLSCHMLWKEDLAFSWHICVRASYVLFILQTLYSIRFSLLISLCLLWFPTALLGVWANTQLHCSITFSVCTEKKTVTLLSDTITYLFCGILMRIY